MKKRELVENSVVEENGKLYLYVETDEDGIAIYKELPEECKGNISLSKMRREGKRVPAFKFEINDPEMYQEYMKNERALEDAWKDGQRCFISGANGKLRRCPRRIPNPNYTSAENDNKTVGVKCECCPYFRLFGVLNRNVFFSTLDLEDENGEIIPFEPEGEAAPKSEQYYKILSDFIKFVSERFSEENCTKKQYEKVKAYVEMLKLLGEEISIQKAAKKMGKSEKTLYSWREALRPIYAEFRENTNYLWD